MAPDPGGDGEDGSCPAGGRRDLHGQDRRAGQTPQDQQSTDDEEGTFRMSKVQTMKKVRSEPRAEYRR